MGDTPHMVRLIFVIRMFILTHRSHPDSRGEFDGFSKNKIFSTKQTLLNFHMMGVDGELLH